MKTAIPSSWTRFPLLLACVLGFVVFAMACEASASPQAPSADSAETTVEPAATTEALSEGVQVLKWSSERMALVTSFAATMTMDVVRQGQSSRLSMEMQTSDDGRTRTVMNISILGQEQTVESIVDGSHVYTKIPLVGWLRMDAGALDLFGGPTRDALGLDFFSNLLPEGEVPWELYTVRSLGRDQVDGIDTEHLSVDIDFQEVWDHLDDGRQNQVLLGLAPPPGTLDVSELLGETRIRDLEIWIDNDGYSRRQALTFDLGSAMSANVDTRMFGFGEDAVIPLPTQYQDLADVSIPGFTLP